VHTYCFWEGEGGYKHYLQMRVENCKKLYMEEMATKTARLYAGTGEEKYARQTALILNRLAEVYPHYSLHGIESWARFAPVIYDIQPLPDPPGGLQPIPGLARELTGYNLWPPLGKAAYPFCAARRGDSGDNWFYAEMPGHLALAYDLIAASAEVDRLSEELGVDVRDRIERFFRRTANHVRTFPIYLGNTEHYLIGGFAVIGRVIGEPEFVHDAFRRARLLLEYNFYPDGMWREGTPSYHQQTVPGLLRVMRDTLQGYSDPEGYVSPMDGLHLANLDPVGQLPFVLEAQAAVGKMTMPSGYFAAIHDTWSQTSRGRPLGSPPDEPLQTHLLWGMGHAVMGVGVGDSGTQVQLHFSGGYGHEHADTLGVVLYSHGKELLSDIGYTHTSLRPFTRDSLAHNLVLIDGKSQRTRGDDPPADGYLVSWGVLGDLLRFCEAGAEGAYPGLARLYRRAISLVALPGGGGYVVDIFRVKGGAKHDWRIHGSADEEQTLTASARFKPFPGSLLPSGVAFERWGKAEGQGGATEVNGHNILYGLFEDLQSAPADETFSATFSCPTADNPALQTTVLGLPGTTAYMGTLPSVRRAREDNEKVWDFRMPAVLLRREGPDLESTFAAVHLPYQGVPPLRSIRRVELAGTPADAVGLVCEGETFADYHLIGSHTDAEMRAAQIPLSARARYAFVRTVNGQPTAMALVDGTEVRFREEAIVLPPAASGNITGVRRKDGGDSEDALIVSTTLTPRPALPHECVIVSFGNGMTYGLSVSEIRREGDSSVIRLAHRPGFGLTEDGDGAIHTHHPRQELPGRPRFRLQNTALLHFASDP
jgi:hypothetical protein